MMLPFQTADQNYPSIEMVNPVTNQLRLLGPLLEEPRQFVHPSFWSSLAWQRNATIDEVQQDRAVHNAAANFERFCQLESTRDSVPSIPQNIHFIWLGTPVPPEVAAVISSWKTHHPDWTITIWTDKEADQILAISPRMHRAFLSAETWAEKSDILRLLILNEIGGIYADTDAVCLKPFDDVISKGFTFVGGIEMNFIWQTRPGEERRVPLCMGSAIIAAAPGSSVIKYCLEHYRTLEEAPSVNLVMRAGPGLMGRACTAALLSPEEQDKVLVLPCSYLYPFPFEHKAAFNQLESTMTPAEKVQSLARLAKEYIAPESLAVHLWVGSWLPNEVHKQVERLVRIYFFGLEPKE